MLYSTIELDILEFLQNQKIYLGKIVIWVVSWFTYFQVLSALQCIEQNEVLTYEVS